MFKLTLLVSTLTSLVIAGCVSNDTSTSVHAVEAPEDASDEAPGGSGDCDPASIPRPPSCLIADLACAGSPLLIAQEFYSQLTPGCGWIEGGISIGVDIPMTDFEDEVESATVAACDALSCMMPSNPVIVAAQASCAAGTAISSALDCSTKRALCENDLVNQQPVSCHGIDHDYPCPYSPSVQACADGAPRDENDLLADCGAVVEGYDDVSGPTAGQCVAQCLTASREAGASCGQ